MMSQPVRSPRNPRVSRAARLVRARDRRETGCTLVEGPHLLAEGLEARVEVVEVFALEDDDRTRALADVHRFPLVPVTREVLDRLAPTESPRGPVAVVRIPSGGIPIRDLLVLHTGDPGNTGTLVRAAAAFGMDVVCLEGAADPWSPKVVRASAGAVFRTVVGDAVPDGYGTIATVVAGGIDPRRLPDRLDPGRRWAVLVGDEARGLDPETASAADVRVTIPMPGGTESLNAAVAGGIVAYELSRLRNPGGDPGDDR